MPRSNRMKMLPLAASVFVLMGCQPRMVDVKGDVFIVTKGGDNVKLGLVQVSAIEEAAATAHLTKRLNEMEASVKDLKKRIAAAEAALNEKSSLSDSEKLTRMQIELASLADADNLVPGMPQAVVATKTDADGKFSMKLPLGKKYVLVAFASRHVGPEAEKYFWAVSVDPEKPPTPLFLSNDNMWKG